MFRTFLTLPTNLKMSQTSQTVSAIVWLFQDATCKNAKQMPNACQADAQHVPSKYETHSQEMPNAVQIYRKCEAAARPVPSACKAHARQIQAKSEANDKQAGTNAIHTRAKSRIMRSKCEVGVGQMLHKC
jgi:hypothetical protein